MAELVVDTSNDRQAWEVLVFLEVQHLQDTHKVVTFLTITKDMQHQELVVPAGIFQGTEDQTADLA
jgi:hypothetical protein